MYHSLANSTILFLQAVFSMEQVHCSMYVLYALCNTAYYAVVSMVFRAYYAVVSMVFRAYSTYVCYEVCV